MAAKNTIPESTWDEQAMLYALGFKHGNQIAMEFGVSPQTVSREMKKRGAIKGSRVDEVLMGLKVQLDLKARRRTLMDLMDSQHRVAASRALMDRVGHMVAALLEADRQGDLSLAAPAIADLEHMLGGVRRKRRRR